MSSYPQNCKTMIKMDKSTATALDNILSHFPSNPSNCQGTEDSGAGGENSGGVKHTRFASGSRVASPNETGDSIQTPVQLAHDPNTPGLLSYIGYYIIRTAFYLAFLAIIAVGGLYVAKLGNFYDPCEQFHTIRTECEVISYAQGNLYYVDCFEEHDCLLPGFSYNTTKKEWSLTDPRVQDELSAEVDAVTNDSL